jgi:hypothetical protein
VIASAAAWAALAALWAGVLAHAASRIFPPVDIMLPSAIGAVVGGGLSVAVRRLRLSRPRPVVAIAIAATLAALVLQLGLDFRAARAARAARVERSLGVRVEIGVLPREELEGDRAAAMQGWTLGRYARERIGLDDSGRLTGLPPLLGRAGALAMTALQLVLALAIAVLLARRSAAEPACPRCGAWREAHPLGAAAHGVARELVAAVREGDADGAAALVRPPDTREAVMMWRLACPDGHDGDGGVLRVSEVIWTRRRRRLVLQRVADLEAGEDLLAPLVAALARQARAERRAG